MVRCYENSTDTPISVSPEACDYSSQGSPQHLLRCHPVPPFCHRLLRSHKVAYDIFRGMVVLREDTKEAERSVIEITVIFFVLTGVLLVVVFFTRGFSRQDTASS